MATRILHCGSNLENYNICIKEKVAGFINRGPEPGDMIYLSVNIDDKFICTARGILGEITDYKPWPDAENYVHSLRIQNMEFCKPVDIKPILYKAGGSGWYLIYIQRAKKVDDTASKMLDSAFTQNMIHEYIELKNPNDRHDTENTNNELSELVTEEGEQSIRVEEKINITGTYQTVKFANETDKIMGLEVLVNDKFYKLFKDYPFENTLLIPENRMFISAGLNNNGKQVSGIKSIPDGLLIVFNKENKELPLEINIIEYECYGLGKYNQSAKTNYFNGQIIPQLIKFATNFSIVTDKQIRDLTTKYWVSNIIKYIFSDTAIQNKVTEWLKQIMPGIQDTMIALEISNLLEKAFKTKVKILLIIDELSSEQSDTLMNVIKAFKLENTDSIQFKGFTVKLVQKIDIGNDNIEYGLTVQ